MTDHNAPDTPPSPQPQVPRPRKKSPPPLGWPMAVLLLGLAAVGGCCYGFTALADSLLPRQPLAAGPSVGVLVLENEIFASIWVTEAVHRFQADPNIRAVVLRVNSPGGAVAPCQEIFRALRGLAKPVVVSMGSVAASGGLYVAVAGDVILANPGSITGSIGVIMQSVEASGAMTKLGLTSRTIKSGPYKDIGSPFRAMEAGEEALLNTMVLEVYEQFVADLAAGRPKLTGPQLRALADGRVFSGAEAHRLGLVDELGGFEEALAWAARLGGLPEGERPEVVIEDGRKPWWETVMTSQALNLSLPPALQPGVSLKYIYQPNMSGGEEY